MSTSWFREGHGQNGGGRKRRAFPVARISAASRERRAGRKTAENSSARMPTSHGGRRCHGERRIAGHDRPARSPLANDELPPPTETARSPALPDYCGMPYDRTRCHVSGFSAKQWSRAAKVIERLRDKGRVQGHIRCCSAAVLHRSVNRASRIIKRARHPASRLLNTRHARRFPAMKSTQMFFKGRLPATGRHSRPGRPATGPECRSITVKAPADRTRRSDGAGARIE